MALCSCCSVQVEVVPEDQRELDQAGALHAHCLQVAEEPNNVRRQGRLGCCGWGFASSGGGGISLYMLGQVVECLPWLCA